MRYRMGIDLGTASIGAVALALDEHGTPTGCPWNAVRIFPEPLEPGQGGLKPKKTRRREARQQRRQIERRARRMRRIAHLAHLLGLDKSQVKPHPGPGFIRLRAQAARECVTLDDLLRILLRLAKRRGYKGEFRTVKKNREAGMVQTGSGKLAEAMEHLARERGVEQVTLGEYLQYRHDELGLPTRMKLDQEGVDDLYSLRAMVEAEFEQIWMTQAEYHPILNGDYRGRPIKEHFRKAIFFQRPLKSPTPLVGKCPLEPNLPRSPRAQPAAQSFRIEKTIADLRWGMGRRAIPLTPEQKAVLRQILNDPDRLDKDGNINFDTIYRELKQAGCQKPDSQGLNLDRGNRYEIKGNTTLVAFKKLGLLDAWQALDYKTQIQVINFLADLGSPEQLDDDNWHMCIRKAGARDNRPENMRTFSPELIAFINRMREHEKFDRLSKMGFEGGRSAYSIKALERLNEWLRNPVWEGDPGSGARIDEEAAIRHCYAQHFTREDLERQLPVPPRTGNDVVDGALRELRQVVNQCIEQLGAPPAEIIIEMARELGAGVERRNEWERRAAANQKRRKEAAEKIASAGKVATGTSILRYLLWEEQEECCPYCERRIGLHEALGGDTTHLEHILPRSLTRIGRKRSELVLSHRECNAEKGDRTPWQAWGSDEQRWIQIEERARRFEELGRIYRRDRPRAMAYFRKARLLTLKDYADEVLTDESIEEFADRQLHQSSWIARAATSWLGSICPNVFASRGEMTAGLRAAWRLDTVIPEVRYEEGRRVFDGDGKPVDKKDFERFRAQWEGRLSDGGTERTARRLDKRIDHRHHLIDALVTAMTSRGLYQKMARRYVEQTEAIRRGERIRHDWSIEPPLRDVRRVALDLVRCCNLSHKPDHFPNGRFFKDTAYGIAYDEANGKWRLTLRCRLLELADDDKEKTLSNIETIVSPEIRRLVKETFVQRLHSGKEPRQALSEPIKYERYGTQIRKVKCFQEWLADNAVVLTHRSRAAEHMKHMLADGYACLDLFKTADNGIKRVHLVSISQFRNEPEPRGAIRFFKGDTVVDEKDGRRYLIHQFKAQGDGMIIMAPITETRPVRKITAADGLRKVSGRGLLRLKLDI